MIAEIAEGRFIPFPGQIFGVEALAGRRIQAHRGLLGGCGEVHLYW